MRRNWLDSLRASKLSLVIAVVLFGAESPLLADMVMIDFEGIDDSTFVTTQYPGLSISNLIVLRSGISLNEFDFPPRSGANVGSDSGGPIALQFDSPVLRFRAFFTYVVPVSIQAYDSSNSLIGSTTTLFGNNTVSGGDPGGVANELMELTSATGFSRLFITGDNSGSSFTLDDLEYETASTETVVPEPTTFGIALGLAILAVGARARKRN